MALGDRELLRVFFLPRTGAERRCLVVLKEEVEWSCRPMWGRSFPAILRLCDTRLCENKKPMGRRSTQGFFCAQNWRLGAFMVVLSDRCVWQRVGCMLY